MRLIDADKFKQEVAAVVILNGYNAHLGNVFCDIIDKQPTAYDVDKVIALLEEYAHGSICKTHEHGCPYLNIDDVSCENCGAMGAVEIAKSGGIE